MPATATRIEFDQFLAGIDAAWHPFVLSLHDYAYENSCKADFDDKKSGLFSSYKLIKTKRVLMNIFTKKGVLKVRIYGENHGSYNDYINSLPKEMQDDIAASGDCRAFITEKGCGPKCTGYVFMIGEAEHKKCRYSCFEFDVTESSMPHIQKLVELELTARMV